MHANQHCFFQGPCPSLSFSGTSNHASAPSLLPSQMMPAQAPAFNLGLNLNLPTSSVHPSTFFSPSIAPVGTDVGHIKNLMDISEHAQPSFGLITGTAKAFAKDALPESAKSLGVLVSAATAGKKLSERIQDSLDSGVSKTEAYTCESARTLSEELTGKLIKNGIVGGIPPYLTMAAANPALAITVPFVLPLLPEAYKGAQTFSEVVGHVTHQTCHQAFDVAKQLSQGPKP